MSYLTEKMSYIRGLAEGLEIDETTKEGKLLLAIVEALSDTADEVYELTDAHDELQQQVDEIDEDLDVLEGYVYDDEDEFEDDEEYEVECPYCHDMIYLDPELISEDQETITCPSCNKEIDLEFDDCDCDGCNCDNCGD